jgi:hypothetical protein
MYAREVDVTRLRKSALLGNGRLEQYPDGVHYGVGLQAISRGTEMKTSTSTTTTSVRTTTTTTSMRTTMKTWISED